MAGEIAKYIQLIIDRRSKGDSLVAQTTKTKLILKGFDPNRFGASTPDDPGLIAKIKQVAGEMGVAI